MSKELHCLVQGCPGITKGTNTILFLLHADMCTIPSNRTVTYARIVINYCPQKEDPNQVHIPVGGNFIDYPFELTTRTANMVSSKFLWNSDTSTKDARIAGTNVKNMYLETLLDQFEYMKIPIALLPEDIIEHYQLQEKVLDGLSTWRFAKECMDCRRPASLPTNYPRNIWHIMGTLSNPTHQDYGNMSFAWCGSTYVWTILVLSILEYNIYMMHYERKHMKLFKIEQATYIGLH
jgi:hypothetical protein